MSISYISPAEHIESIRAEFGITNDLSRSSTDRRSKSLHQAIVHLSEGLYSKDIHFVLELIQNAEDNSYNPHVIPDLTFRLLATDPTGQGNTDGALLIINNEVGFQPENVDALCAVGQSTKKKQEGYIGEKGIGFKSVFLVSDQPHLFSNGYSFKFSQIPDQQAGFGYIVPTWVKNFPDQVNHYFNQTCILLPLKLGKQAEVTQQLRTFAPETILFLSKLQQLSIEIQDTKTLQVIRDDASAPVVDMLVGDSLSRFWVITREFVVPPNIEEPKRDGIQTRKVSVALPLTRSQELTGQVYSFLPTEVSSGLPFLINADFLLSASRETLQFDRPWNIWLRDCVASVFVKSFTDLILHSDFRFQAYSFIPLTATSAFFEQIIEGVYQELKKTPVVWVECGPRRVIARRARLATSTFRKLFQTDTLPAQLRRTPLIHPAIEQHRKQLIAIGVQPLSSDEILNCLKDELWLAMQDAKWFSQVYDYLSQLTWTKRNAIQNVPLLLDHKGVLRRAVSEIVYFPTDISKNIQDIQTRVSIAPQLSFLNEEIYDQLKGNSRVIEWLRGEAGIQALTVDTYTVNLIEFLAQKPSIPINDLITLTKYIRDRFSSFNAEIKQIVKQSLPLLLANNVWTNQQKLGIDKQLVFPPVLDPDLGWQHVFPDPDDHKHLTILSDKYLEDQKDSQENERWRLFFGGLGAVEFPTPRVIKVDSYSDELNPYERTLLSRFRARFDQQYPSSRSYPSSESITNVRPPHWLSELWAGRSTLSQELLVQRGKALLKWLKAQLPQQLGQEPRWVLAHYQGHYRTWQNYNHTSEFKEALLKAPWFPSTHGNQVPNQVFADRVEVREFFADTVPYVVTELESRIALWLSVRTTATANDLMLYLRSQAQRPPAEVDPNLVHKIYDILAQRTYTYSDVKTSFEQEPLILITKPHARWVTTKEVIWPNVEHIFGDTYVYLEQQYEARYKSFFVDRLGIPVQLDTRLYADAWLRLTERIGSSSRQIESALSTVYAELLRFAKGSDHPIWWVEFCKIAKVWTQRKKFEPATAVYLPDDGEFVQTFGEKAGLVWIPRQSSVTELRPLFDAFGIRSLADQVHSEPVLKGASPISVDERLLTVDAKRAVCFFLWNEHKSHYEQIKQSGKLAEFIESNEQRVDRLGMTYRLGSLQVEVPESAAFWSVELRTLYVSAQHAIDQLEIEVPPLIARKLTNGPLAKSLEDFIGRVLHASQAKIDMLHRKHNWLLPEVEMSWFEALVSSQIVDEMEQRKEVPSEQPGSEDLSDLNVTTQDQHKPSSESSSKASLPTSENMTGESDSPLPNLSQPEHERLTNTHGFRSQQPTDRLGHRRTLGNRRQHQARIRQRHFRPRLRSYVTPRQQHASDITDRTTVQQRLQIDQAGVECVLAFERRHGRTPIEMPHHNPGYDITSQDQQGNTRYIEVKSLGGSWDESLPPGLSHTQYNAAHQYGTSFWLYVVERATSTNYRIYCIQNPVQQIDQYLFDSGWQALSKEE